ncbi:MAG TPA: PBPRA1643 family SWIM/SEC-C metal-binding motif protein [Candidatus Binatus sp.]|nr:PBPRA1643 family SWIM/SEC-C metal-binding motif protein [Candidatus Binatus sp.]
MRSRVEADGWMDNFGPKNLARLGSEKNPAIIQVQSAARLAEVSATLEKHGWNFRIGIEPDKPEDVDDLERLLHPQKPIIVEKKAGRNELCRCGSGKKSKHCCGK